MKEKLAKIREEILKQIDASENLDKLNEVRVSALGKKGALTELLKSMKEVAPQDRPKVGQMVNEVRAEIETALETEKAKLEDRAMEARLKNEVIDVTLPAKKNSVGHRHPNTIALEEVERIFVGMGYEVVRRSRSREGLLQLRSAEYPERTIRQETSRIPSISMRKSSCVPRPLRFRFVPWNRASCRSV